MADSYNHAERVKCPLCDKVFEDEKAGEAMPDKDPEKQAHFKALQHFSDEHQDWMDENTGFPGLVPVETEVENDGRKPEKLENVVNSK